MNNNFDEDKLKRLSRAAKVFVYNEVDSTNTRAKKLAQLGAAHATLVVAVNQTDGKGRQGKNFFCKAGSGIYMSVILRNCSDFMLITSAAAAAVRRAILKICGKSCDIKWVNDIYYNGLKVCGILAESVCDTCGKVNGAVVGIGVNLFKTDYPQDIVGKAGALYDSEIKGAERDELINPQEMAATDIREVLCAEITAQLLAFCKNITEREFINDCRSFSMLLGKSVTVESGAESYTAYAKSIDDSGALIVEKDGNEIKLVGGEVSLSI